MKIIIKTNNPKIHFSILLVSVFLLGNSLGIMAQDPLLIDPVGNATFSGNVGIGTTSPNNLLDLGSSLGKKLAVYQNANGTSFYGLGISSSTLEIHAGSSTSGTPKMVVKRNGNVGIGTSDLETYKLNVSGSLFASTATFSTSALINNVFISNKGSSYWTSFRHKDSPCAALYSDQKGQYTYLKIDPKGEPGYIGFIVNGGNSPQIVFNKNGNVGIGTANPIKGKLEISGATYYTIGAYAALSSAAVVTKQASENIPISVYGSARIAANQFAAFSDARIKNIKGISKGKEDLTTLNQIEITDYTYIDRPVNGNQAQKKVIGQQLAKVFPQAVSTKNIEIIPDIMETTIIKDGWVDLPDHDLKSGEKIRLIFEDGHEELEIIAIIKNAFQVSSDRDGKVFVYGKEVDNFHIVDYEAISMLNVSATQELAKQIEQLLKENKAQTLQIKDLEKEKENLHSSLKNMEDRLQKIEASLQQ